MYIQVHDALVLWLNMDGIELGMTAMPGSRSCPLCHPVKILVSVCGLDCGQALAWPERWKVTLLGGRDLPTIFRSLCDEIVLTTDSLNRG